MPLKILEKDLATCPLEKWSYELSSSGYGKDYYFNDGTSMICLQECFLCASHLGPNLMDVCQCPKDMTKKDYGNFLKKYKETTSRPCPLGFQEFIQENWKKISGNLDGEIKKEKEKKK